MAKIQAIKRKPKENSESNPIYFVTLPLQIIKGFGWKKGDNLVFSILGKDKLKLEKLNELKQSSPGNDRGDL